MATEKSLAEIAPGEKRILFLTQFDFLKTGNQSFLNTVRGYVEGGFRVVVLTGRPRGDTIHLDPSELPDDIRDHVEIHFFTPLLRILAKAVSGLLGLFRKREASSGQAAGNAAVAASPSLNFGVESRFGNLMEAASLISFLSGGFIKAVWLALTRRVDAVYGYEIYGASLAGVVSAVTRRRPLVTRFQGTVLHPYLAAGDSVWRFPAHATAMTIVRPDLLMMANDGTLGYEVCKMLKCDLDRVRFWMNGVSHDVFPIPGFAPQMWREENQIPADAFLMIVTSRVIGWKRLDRALDLMAAIKELDPNRRWLLTIIGDGEARLGLIEQARQRGLNEDVRFLGWMPHGSINKYLNGCDCLLSLNNVSNLGNPIIEALHIGKIVGTLKDGSTEGVLEPDSNAIVVDPAGFPGNLAKALVRLRDDEPWRRQMQENIAKGRDVMSWSARMGMEVGEVKKLLRRK